MWALQRYSGTLGLSTPGITPSILWGWALRDHSTNARDALGLGTPRITPKILQGSSGVGHPRDHSKNTLVLGWVSKFGTRGSQRCAGRPNRDRARSGGVVEDLATPHQG